jgi:hypothetical protein
MGHSSFMSTARYYRADPAEWAAVVEEAFAE